MKASGCECRPNMRSQRAGQQGLWGPRRAGQQEEDWGQQKR